mgnify:CR=1 FL=1
MSRCAPRTPRAVAALAWLLAAACHAQPGTAPMMAATAAALQVPPALQGRWTPVSKSLSGAGPLSLSAHTLTWSPCGPAPRAITAQNGPDGWLLTLPGRTGCRLGGDPVIQLCGKPHPRHAHEVELSAFIAVLQTLPLYPYEVAVQDIGG